MLREQLFIELLVSLLALSFPKVAYLEEIKLFEDQKNKKVVSQESSENKQLDRSNLHPLENQCLHFFMIASAFN